MDRKVAIVTGASRGIGKKIAIDLAKSGYNVVINYNQSEDLAKQVLNEVLSCNVEGMIVKCDIADENQVKNMVYETIKKFGHIDVLVNNAGIAIDSVFDEKSVENFKRTIDVNLIGTFLVSKYVGQEMFANKSGKIVNISSTNGINTYYPMCLDYDASKAGINSLTHNLAMQFSPFVNVNAVAPGFIATESETKDMDEEFIKLETEKIFLKRVGQEQDVSNLVLFLVSDKASFINSAVIRIDGGMYGE